ncbi:MAG TPA: hypothetical protein VE870_03120 [Bacteroidales bacterium]|nr:hypothetical protein [Bacteroidales bacterium]
MANYVRQTEAKKMNMVNPYPGLRPFSTIDAQLFFGRSEEVEEMTANLMKNRILVITGGPGIGKTSLVNAGLIPSLMNQGDWIIFKTRPGSTPLKDLYSEINKNHGKDPSSASKTDTPEPAEIMHILSDMHKEYQAGVLIIVDQFEEIFTRNGMLSEDRQNKQREMFVDFLLQAAGQQAVPVHIIITIRSDFLDECFVFHEFSDFIDLYRYPINKLSVDNITRAIMGPLEVSNVSIQRDLVKKIITDIQDNPDSLPVLQHALMRTWHYWHARKEPETPISLEDYERLGSIDHAISKYADEAYGQLSDEEKEYCERLFRALTERDHKNRDICIPLRVSKLSEISQIPVEKVIRLADIFRREGRGFLTPGIDTPLDKNTVLRISHESLMTLWYRLDEWADNEYESVQMYLNLAEAAGLYQVGKAELWRPPELETALEWYRINKPNLAWAERHNPAFERTMVFLTTSEREYAIEEEDLFQEERRKRVLNRILAGILGVAAVIAIVIFSIQHTRKPVPATQEVMQTRTEEPDGSTQAQTSSEEPAAITNENNQDITTGQAGNASPDLAAVSQPDADKNAGLQAGNQTDENMNRQAVNHEVITRNQAEVPAPDRSATVNKPNTTENRTSATQSNSEPASRRTESQTSVPEVVLTTQKVLPVIKSMTNQSVSSSGDPDLHALLAYQAFLFNKEYNKDNFDAGIYTGLYQSVKTFRGNDFNVYEGHTNAVRSVDFMPNSSSFFSGGSDGTIMKWSLDNQQKKPSTILSGHNIIDLVKVSPNGKWLLFAESNAGLNLINLSGRNYTPDLMTGSEKNIRTIALAPDNNSVYTAGLDNYIEFWNITVRAARKLTDTESRVNALVVSPDGLLLAGGLRNGQLTIWKLKDNLQNQVVRGDNSDAIQSLSFSKNGRYLACGTLNGNILVYNTGNFQLIGTLKGHKARVTSLAFSPDGSRLVSGSYDGQVLLWDFANMDSQPVKMTDNAGFIFTVAFSPDGNYFVSGSAKEPRLVARPAKASLLASQICMLVKRDMTKEEWDTYVGNDIPYRKTCSGTGSN